MGRPGRARASVLWGAIGALSFLVLSEAYVFVSDAGLSLVNLLLAGVVVFALATGASYLADPYLARLDS